MDRVRHIAGLMVILTIPLALAYWFVVHPFIRFWRRLGLAMSYTALTVILITVLYVCYHIRWQLLGVDYGVNWLLVGAGVTCFIVATIIGQAMKRQFTVAKLLGVQEIKRDASPQELVTKGIYSKIRHPRYASVLLGLIGLSLIANYLGAYIATALFVPGIYAIILLEERELTERFGDGYREYRKRVPRFIPRLTK
jgi:protein-S-isoprenylcysteine O-methyltransferase Ste14